ncbi:MAG: tRNA preQ1(34) S-adenosylmethionine ribosyltransferase-isomerase QueA [Cyanobacteria bacterium P01_H01_bin.74]
MQTDTSFGFFDKTRSGAKLDDYNYPLPEDKIARYPLQNRDDAKMLVLDRQTGRIVHTQFKALSHYLQPGDLMVLNNTKVLPARFLGCRQGHTGTVEVFLLHPDNTKNETQTGRHVWSALLRPARKLKPGTIITLANTDARLEILSVGNRGNGRVGVHLTPSAPSVEALMESFGHMPIPPYLNRNAEETDKTRYQTVFSTVPGAQAAPTAGLHFTPELLVQLKDQGVNQAAVTLAVSAGTFRTVDTADITAHHMDPEWYDCPSETTRAVQLAKQKKQRILAIGTTVAKTLESIAAGHGEAFSESESPRPYQDWSQLYIYPGFQFKTIDALLTNFHLPKSTLLMLVSAFCKRHYVAGAYQAALENNYRFFSYGDCMLII